MGSSEAVRALEGWVRHELRTYALALRRLAYTLPNGVGEHELLQLSEQMNAAAGRELGAIFSSVGLEDWLEPQTPAEQASPTIDEIRALFPDWPDTNGIPWQMCGTCHKAYDTTCFRPHDCCRQSE